MKHLILAAATLLLINGADARERRGPPPACPQPKVDCCEKPKPCKPKPCKPKPCKKECPKPCEPCCPPVCFERGFPTDPCCTPSAYSEPAAIELLCGWDTIVTANFIYWEAMQGGMDLAVPGQGSDPTNHSATGQNVLFQDFEYKPGFQVGLGWSGGRDHWKLYAEYTWLHASTHTSSTAPGPGALAVNGIALPQDGVWLLSSWFGEFENDISTTLSSNWGYKIDLVDAQISRPFYSGTHYLVEPFFGLRGAWIRQSLKASVTPISVDDFVDATPSQTAVYRSRSSAVGPRIGINGDWHFGYGFRFLGNAAASILFTGYDVKQNVNSADAEGTFVYPQSTQMDDYNALRPNFDLSLGLGWGSYFCCRRAHFDLSATYDFSVFFEQNMMRYLADVTYDKSDGAVSNLYLHGLTVQTRFDF